MLQQGLGLVEDGGDLVVPGKPALVEEETKQNKTATGVGDISHADLFVGQRVKLKSAGAVRRAFQNTGLSWDSYRPTLVGTVQRITQVERVTFTCGEMASTVTWRWFV